MQENKQEKSPIKQRILLFLAHKGVSPYEFYKNSGVTRGVLAQNNGISEDNLTRFISYFPTINLIWLMSGKGSMEVEADAECISTVEETERETQGQEISPNESTNTLLSELVATIKSQAEEIGRLKAENAELKRHAERLAALVSTDSTAHVG